MKDQTFIQHPFSSIRGHLIRVNALLDNMAKQANIGTGLHYELFQYNMLVDVIRTSEALVGNDKDVFLAEAKRQGYNPDELSIYANERASILHGDDEEYYINNEEDTEHREPFDPMGDGIPF